MADEKKNDPNLDDWDSLPLDPDDTDWDEPSPAAPPESPVERPESPDAGRGPQADEMVSHDDLVIDDLDVPKTIQLDDWDGPEEAPTDDLPPAEPPSDGWFPGDQAPAGHQPPAASPPDDGWFLNDPPQTGEQPPAEPPSDGWFPGDQAPTGDQPPAASPSDDGWILNDPPQAGDQPPAAAPSDDLFPTNGPPAAVPDDLEPTGGFGEAAPLDPPTQDEAPLPRISPADTARPETGSFQSQLDDAEAAGDSMFDLGVASGPRSHQSLSEKLAADLEELPTKKVELDIEGIFLEEPEDLPAPPPVEEEAPPPPEPAPSPPPKAPVESPKGSKKIPKTKLLLLAVPAIVLVLGLGFGVYKLFFSSSAGGKNGPAMTIDPRVPPREPTPGTLDLGPFYLNFTGGQSEIIVEMNVALHYKDLPDKMAVEQNLTRVRDIVLRVSQGLGDQIVSDGESQRTLRRDAAEKINAALGGEKIDYVQITQIRILH